MNWLNELEKRIKNTSEIIVFSPHLDDSVFSLGNMCKFMVNEGKNVQIVNIFTKGSGINSVLTEKLLRQAGVGNADEYFLMRKKEDVEALSKLGVKNFVNLDLVDAAWRGENNLAFYPNTALGVSNILDEAIGVEVKAKISQYVSQEALVFAPLARGKHIDHITTRNVVRSLFKNVIHFMDQPYSGNYNNEMDFVKENHLNEAVRITEAFKTDSVKEYGSQKGSLANYGLMNLTTETFYL